MDNQNSCESRKKKFKRLKEQAGINDNMTYVYIVKLRLNIERYRLKEEKSHLLYTEADIS